MELGVHSIGSYRSHLRQEHLAQMAQWKLNVGATWIMFEVVALIFFGGMLFERLIN